MIGGSTYFNLHFYSHYINTLIFLYFVLDFDYYYEEKHDLPATQAFEQDSEGLYLCPNVGCHKK